MFPFDALFFEFVVTTSGAPTVLAEQVHWQVPVVGVGLERVGSAEPIGAVVGEVLVHIPSKV